MSGFEPETFRTTQTWCRHSYQRLARPKTVNFLFMFILLKACKSFNKST